MHELCRISCLILQSMKSKNSPILGATTNEIIEIVRGRYSEKYCLPNVRQLSRKIVRLKDLGYLAEGCKYGRSKTYYLLEK